MSLATQLRTTLAHPLTRFGGVGLALFLLGRASEPPPPPLAPPGTSLSDTELLFRAGVTRDFPRSRPEIRERLVADMISYGTEGRSEDALVEEAIALGFVETDPAVRGQIVRAMRRELARDAWRRAISARDVAAYYGADPQRFGSASLDEAEPRVRAALRQDRADAAVRAGIAELRVSLQLPPVAAQ